jgi:ParB family chromosome partitioning protein
MAKPALGRGLGALIAPSKAAAAAVAAVEAGGERVLNVPLTKVVPSPLQPRTTFQPEPLAEMVESILANGIIQPLEQKDPCAFAYDEAIASVIERPGHSSAA